MNADVTSLLTASNPWLTRPEAYAAWVRSRRPAQWTGRVIPRAADWPVEGKAHLLLGARQVGKSSFLREFFLHRGEVPLIVNAEEKTLQLWAVSAGRVASDLPKLLVAGTPVLFEEAQHLPEAGLFIKGLVDAGLQHPLYVTGSSVHHLHSRTRESLAGRAVRAFLAPFGLHEIGARHSHLPPLLREAAVRDAALDLAVWGGYPEVFTATDAVGRERALLFLLESFVLRDASDLFKIEKLAAFRQILFLAAGQIGNLVNTSEWAALAAISRDTAQSYIDVLEESHIVARVPPFVGGKRSELTHQPKIYFRDNGIRNFIARSMQPFAERTDRGALFENLTASELLKHLDPLHPMDTLRFWRSTGGAEVDFVIERPDGLLAIECKAASMSRPELSRSARSFIDAYAPARFVVLNLAVTHDLQMGATRVMWRPPEWLEAPLDDA